MTSGTTPCFSSNSQGFQIYGVDDILYPSHNLLYNLSVLRDKVQQLETLAAAALSPNQILQESIAMEISGVGNIVRQIITAASSTAFILQQIGLDAAVPSHDLPQHQTKVLHQQESTDAMNQQVFHNNLEGARSTIFSFDVQYHNANQNSGASDHGISVSRGDHQNMGVPHEVEKCKESRTFSLNGCGDVIEMDAATLLAKYSHYCQVCGKGFKREANLRMHMRAHGDEYKTAAALSNPMKNISGGSIAQKATGSSQRYSCPQKGCRWNKNHASFQPLKSMACVKNHYKRSHCPKMYVCNRCNHKKFSVLSDLRTHEKHCGDLNRWRCSCGTNFSRKDKLMGHVALFSGHTPVVTSFYQIDAGKDV